MSGAKQETGMEILPVEAEGKIMSPIVSPENAEKAMQAYQELCAAVLIPWDKRIVKNGVIVQESDYQRIPVRHKERGKWITEYRDFPKKSAWRKLGKFYKISDEIIDKERVDREDGSFVYHYTVKAIAPDGQYTVGVGSCDSTEVSDERRREHFTESKAHTRAKNRAISDLIGFGQVSAEEVTGEPKYVEAQQVSEPKAEVKKEEEPPKGHPERVKPPAQMRSPPNAPPKPAEALADQIETVMSSAELTKVRVYPYGKRVYVDPLDIEQDEWPAYNAILTPLGAAWNRENSRWEIPAEE